MPDHEEQQHAQQHVKQDKPSEEKEVDTDYLGRPIKYVDETERRKKALHLSEEEAAKFNVTESSPASGGVYPPSAVVGSPEALEIEKAQAANQPDPQSPAQQPQPAASTTPATKT